ncbi:MAG: response regulator [Bacteroidales bacterium]|nr:response regulator [Lachnoclostridium sp.]MCM1384218.1 response regulator [Lachnoclostridium sp.]MCM1466494.1 response regulator [Bacteroidales bacterium]
MAFGEKKKIVAVDDSGIVLKMLQKVLGEDYDLHAFSTGMRALKFLKEKSPDLIILDIDMPEINGYEMLKLIKEKDHLMNVPVIFLTSNNDKNHVVKAVAGGAKDYVIKPIDADILLEKVRAQLDDGLTSASDIGWNNI